MGEHILKIGTDELTVVRVTCLKCNGCVEMPPGDIARIFAVMKCPLCDADIGVPGKLGTQPFENLALALVNLGKLKAKIRVEFQVSAE